MSSSSVLDCVNDAVGELLLKHAGASWLIPGHVSYQFCDYTMTVETRLAPGDVDVVVSIWGAQTTELASHLAFDTSASHPSFLEDLDRVIGHSVAVCRNLLDYRYLCRGRTIDEVWEMMYR